MKKYIIGFMSCMILVLLLGASIDRRNVEPYTKKIFVHEVAQITIASAGTTEETTDILINGCIKQIAVTMNDNTSGATATVELRNEDGGVLWTFAAIAENATSVYQYYTLSGTDLPLNILCAGTITVGCTPSKAPSTGGMTCDVELYGD